VTISTETRKAGPYSCNGSQTVFSFAFRVFTSSEVVVTLADSTGVETTLTPSTHYTVSLNSDQDADPGGTITTTGASSPYASGNTLTLTSDVALTQATDLPSGGPWSAVVVERALDKLTVLVQQVFGYISRGLRQPVSDAATIGELPTKTNRASMFLAFDADGDPIAADSVTGVPVTAYMATVLDDTTAAAARATLGAAEDAVTPDYSQVRAFGGRLTLASGTPVMNSDQAGKTTVYFTPYNGDVIPIYDGTDMVPTQFTELSQATTDATKSPAAVAANKNYDKFVWNDAGTKRCTRGPAWSSDTARGTGAGTTELEMVKGVLVNKYDITNGPAAQRGTYVGTIRSNGSSQIDWKLGSSAAGGGEAFLGVWNMYNRVSVAACVRDSTNSWSYNSATIRSLNNSATNRISVVFGLAEDTYKVDVLVFGSSGAASNLTVGIGINSTSVNSAMRQGLIGLGYNGNATAYVAGTALGFNYFQALDINGNGTDNLTRYGLASDTNVTVREALTGDFKC